MAVLRKFLHLEDYLLPLHFENLGKLLLLMSVLWGYFVFNERLTVWYGNEPHEMAVFWATQRGDVRAALLDDGGLQLRAAARDPVDHAGSRTITGCVIASFGVVVGMWLERFLIIVPSLGAQAAAVLAGAATARSRSRS